MYYEVSSHHIQMNGTDFESFGIKAVEKDRGVLIEMSDISSDLSAVSSFVKLMNSEKVELCHFEEVIEDFLFLCH